jgi:DNA-directed RNA polymerase specialized sigma24 family protein
MIKYRYIEDLSIQEISKKLNQPINTTKIKIFRAKKLLSEKLKKND